MKSQIVVITGANSGIGKAAAFQFAREGNTVIMACRDIPKSQPVKDEIIRRTGNSRVELMELNVSSFGSIRSFCSAFTARYPHLDILINNAGYFNHGAPYTLSEDQLEITFATNVFGPFLLTQLLRDHLNKSEDPVILNAGSNIIKHFFDPSLKINFDILQGNHPEPENYKVYHSYRDSKMALLMLTFKMADEFRKDGIRVNSLQINGATMSKETLNKLTPGYRLIARIQNLFFRSPAYTANLYYQICTSESFKHLTGKQFNHKPEVMQPSVEGAGLMESWKQVAGASKYPVYADHKETQEQLWQLCRDLTQHFFQSAEPAE